MIFVNSISQIVGCAGLCSAGNNYAILEYLPQLPVNVNDLVAQLYPKSQLARLGRRIVCTSLAIGNISVACPIVLFLQYTLKAPHDHQSMRRDTGGGWVGEGGTPSFPQSV